MELMTAMTTLVPSISEINRCPLQVRRYIKQLEATIINEILKDNADNNETKGQAHEACRTISAQQYITEILRHKGMEDT